jgi:hypothetical protein
MTLSPAAALASFLLAAHAMAAESPAVYRCGSSYQAAPCAGGVAIATDASPSPEQVAAAQDVAARDRRLADALTQDRERREAHAMPAQAIAIGTPQPPHDTKPAKPAKPNSRKAHAAEKDGVFVAMAPAAGKKKSSKTTKTKD